MCLCLPLSHLAQAPGKAKETRPVASALQPFVNNHTLAGAVTVVADKDKILNLETVGFADIKANKPMQPDTLFWIASMSKPITGTGLMILVDEGKVSLDDPVEKFLPEFKGIMVIAEQDENHVLLKKAKTLMTVRHILSHTSGMRFSSPLEKPTLDMISVRDGVRSHALQPLQWEPGSKYQYSNAGINTGGRIIEVVSGQSYEDFMDKRLFEPLGMKDTTFWPNEEQVARLAKPYKPNAAKNNLDETTIVQLTYPLTARKRQPMPGGGLFSTAKDLTRFCQMVIQGGEFEGKRYLSEKTVKAMTSKQTGELKEGYGIGWSTGGGTFGHGGALATNMAIDPSRGLITVWLVQHAGFPGNGGQSQAAFKKAAEIFVEKK
ncbi:MAG: class A beta-lactamase-related serine hydrolase [Gemmataceae bacterium]|nr:class A beta-lactamase-related serine hydrolase [Gemmataceae bacterium]